MSADRRERYPWPKYQSLISEIERKNKLKPGFTDAELFAEFVTRTGEERMASSTFYDRLKKIRALAKR